MEIGEIMEIREVMGVLPQRYPFLLIDKVLKLDEDGIIALKNVTVNEHFFVGHFPGKPVMPGVLIIEALGQAATILLSHKSKINPQEKLAVFLSIERVRFRHFVVPGDTMHLHVKQIGSRGKVWKVEGYVKVGNTVVTEAAFTGTVIDRYV